MELVLPLLGALFAAAIVVGMTVRAVRAPRGSRMRAAFGPIMGAGETYQELHTGQRGLQDSVIEPSRSRRRVRRAPTQTTPTADRPQEPSGGRTRSSTRSAR